MGDERPDGWTSTRNFHICYARVQIMIGSCPDDWSWIGNFHISCTRVRIKADWRPKGDIWIAILALCMRAFGRESTPSERLKQSSLKLNLDRIRIWSITERRPDGLLRTVASRYSRCPNGKSTSSGRMMLGLTGVRTVWYVVGMDGTVVRWASGRDGTMVRMAGMEPKTSILKAVQNLLTSLWIVESLIKQHLYTQVILSKQNEANNTNKLFYFFIL
jgi:hypothetical protein